MEVNPLPSEEGVTHINIYSKSSLWLGRELSNFAKYKIDTEDGIFNSVEGYWFWLGTHDESLRKMYGHEAKKYGSSLERTISIENDSEFKKKIRMAIFIKIMGNRRLRIALKRSTLPLTHYYYYGTINSAKFVDAGYKWIIEYIENIRQQLKGT